MLVEKQYTLLNEPTIQWSCLKAVGDSSILMGKFPEYKLVFRLDINVFDE